MIALNEIEQTATALTGTGAVDGDTFAISQRSRKDLFVGVQIGFGADPGAYVFDFQVSVDRVTFGQLAPQITGTTVSAMRQFNVTGFKFCRVNQVSKANSVTATVKLMQS